MNYGQGGQSDESARRVSVLGGRRCEIRSDGRPERAWDAQVTVIVAVMFGWKLQW